MTGILPRCWTKDVYPPYSVPFSLPNPRAFEPKAVARGSDTLLVSSRQIAHVLDVHLLRLDFVGYVPMLVCSPRQISCSCMVSRPPGQDRQVHRPREQRDLFSISATQRDRTGNDSLA